MSKDRQWSPASVENALAAQGLSLAPGRSARIAAGLNAATGLPDPLLDALEFEVDPTAYELVRNRCRAK